MISISNTEKINEFLYKSRQGKICIQFPPKSDPETAIQKISSISGPIDVYCWYEGPRGLPTAGAEFMKNSICLPLYKSKKDAKLWLYSLSAWNFKKKVSPLSKISSFSKAINGVNKTFVECVESTAFFQFCTQSKSLVSFCNRELPKKEQLIQISANKTPSNITVGQLFNDQESLFDCLKEIDISAAYSQIQYVEGYYLIRETIKNRLSEKQNKVEIFFLLPNDEDKYYGNLPDDIEEMLRLDFGDKVSDVEINITFQGFFFGTSLQSRPYNGSGHKPSYIKKSEIGSYFNYLPNERN